MKKGLRAHTPLMVKSQSQIICMNDALDDLITKILDQCKIYLDRNEAFVDQYSTLDIDNEIIKMNPTLWNAICMLTRSVSDRRSMANKQTESDEQHKKRLRRFFMLCLMMFCADDRCSMPMHVLKSRLN